MSGTQLVRYDAMCSAIAAAYAVDEVKDIRDKARAFAIYARLAHNTEAERQACEIRLRAERRCGQLLATMDKAKGAATPYLEGSAPPEPLAKFGISHNQSSQWQKLATVAELQATSAGLEARLVALVNHTETATVQNVRLRAKTSFWPRNDCPRSPPALHRNCFTAP